MIEKALEDWRNRFIEPEKVESTIFERLGGILAIIIGVPLGIYGYLKLGIFIGQLLSPYFPYMIWILGWIFGVQLYVLWGLGLIILNLIAFIFTGHHHGYYCIDGGQHNHDGFHAGDCGLSSFNSSWCTKCGKNHG